MPLAVEERLWDLAAELTGDPVFRLHAAAAIRPGAFDVLDCAVRTAPDLRRALHRMARCNRLVHDLANLVVLPAATAVRIEQCFEGVGTRPCRQAAEFTLASLVVVASQIGGQPLKALAVEFAQAAPGPDDDYQQVFGVMLRFDAPVSCLMLAAELLDRPVPTVDPALMARGLGNKHIARELDLSPHTVKRHVAHILDKRDLASSIEAAAWHHARLTG